MTISRVIRSLFLFFPRRRAVNVKEETKVSSDSCQLCCGLKLFGNFGGKTNGHGAGEKIVKKCNKSSSHCHLRIVPLKAWMAITTRRLRFDLQFSLSKRSFASNNSDLKVHRHEDNSSPLFARLRPLFGWVNELVSDDKLVEAAQKKAKPFSIETLKRKLLLPKRKFCWQIFTPPRGGAGRKCVSKP